MFDALSLARQNIRNLAPYSSARDEFQGSAHVMLDANENAFGSPAVAGMNRYPDPRQRELKTRLAEICGVPNSNIFLGNGSDEAIDLLYRIFCHPGMDRVVICPPTYGMYKVYADINDVEALEVPLTGSFDLDVPRILLTGSATTKLLFICSPNNPTGNAMSRDSVLEIASGFSGVVVVDEAYGDFSDEPSLAGHIERFPNLVVLRTCSKAWGMAGLRIGIALASEPVIELLNRIKPPYNISGVAQEYALRGLRDRKAVEAWIADLKAERALLADRLAKIPSVQSVYPSNANFLLVRFNEADRIYDELVRHGIVVRNRSRLSGCENTLRITVGTPEENRRFLQVLEEIS